MWCFCVLLVLFTGVVEGCIEQGNTVSIISHSDIEVEREFGTGFLPSSRD